VPAGDPASLLVDQVSGLAAAPAGAAERVAAYYALLLAWNARINLTGARDLKELVEHHLPDSVVMGDLVPADLELVDVGSGGGLPALPFAILRPDVSVTLVEPRAKRVAFLRAACRETNATNVQVIDGRMESVQSQFDVASSMATFAPDEWLIRAPRLVRPGGLAVVFLREAESLPKTALVVREVDYGTSQRPRMAVLVRVGD
jgi:16S rRNA (guanine527-N7)-methyltransferase